MDKGLIEKLKEVDNEKRFNKRHREGFNQREEYVDSFRDEIVDQGRKALPELKELVQEGHNWSSIFAAQILGQIGRKEAVPGLLDSLEKNEDLCFLCEKVVEALVDIGGEAVPAIKERVEKLLKEQEDNKGAGDVGWHIDALAKINTDSAFEYLKNLVGRVPPKSATSLAFYLGETGRAKAIPPLEKLAERFKDRPRVHREAKSSIEHLKEELETPADNHVSLNNPLQ